MVIAHNISAINTYKSLGMAGGSVNKAMEKLASGFRINKAADDAAGLSISEKMRSQIRGLNQASKNAENGISLIQTAEGALNEVHSILQRMRELAVQSATDTNAQEDRDALQGELEQLINEVDRIADTTQFNGIYLFAGKEKLPNLADDTLNGVTSKINSVVSSFGLSGTPNLANGGKYTLDVSEGLELGKNITIDGSTKVLTTKKADLTIKGSTKYIYDASGNLVYENVIISDLSDKNQYSAFPHISEATSNATKTEIQGYGSIEELAASGKYFVYKPDEKSKLIDGSYEAASGTKNFDVPTEDGKIVHLNVDTGNHWQANMDLYDSEGFKWAKGAQFSNGQLMNHYNYFGYSGNNSMNVVGDKGDKRQLYTNATLTALSSSDITEDTKNYQRLSDVDNIIMNKLKTEIDNLGVKDADGKDLEATITKSALGKYEINMILASDDKEDTIIAFHVGANSNQVIAANLKGMSAKSLYIDELDITTRTNSNTAIDTIDDAIKDVSNMRSTFGAIQNRLEYTINNLNTTGENMTAAESTIRDVDMADQMMEYTKSNILQQAAQAMLIQANSRPQQALQLLRV